MEGKHHPNYFLIWVWLMALVVVSVVASLILPKSLASFLIFAVAGIKALLVILNYMHLKYEKPLIYALVIVPFLFILILTLLLLPDFVFSG
jgi:caa(3)-type oxidase subunit IV